MAPERGGGCTCSYELTFTGEPTGRWAARDPTRPTEIPFFDALCTPPVRTDYCSNVQTGELLLTGHDDQALFNAKSYRTMVLTPPPCDDGVQNFSTGEEGIDCGAPCPGKPCGTCSDGIHQTNEQGIDCGGACLGIMCDPDPAITDDTTRKPACADGKAEPWEEGLDCGGPCAKACM